MKKLLLILAVLVGQITCIYAQDNDPKIWNRTFSYGFIGERPERGELRIKKYGNRQIFPGASFFETYTPRMLCAYSDEKTNAIDSMIYYGLSFSNFEFFGCKVIKGDPSNFHIWYSSALSDNKVIIAITEPVKRDYTIEDLKKIDLNMIMDSMEPVTDTKPDTKYQGDKILGQFVIEKTSKNDLSEIQIEKITVNPSEKDKIAHIEMQMHDKSIYKFTFDPEKKIFSKVEN